MKTPPQTQRNLTTDCQNLLGFAALTVALLHPTLSAAEVESASSTHYRLTHSATSALPPEELWARLITPSAWWHPDHTYSGDANNLVLNPQAGGLWREDWAGGSVEHGRVLTALPPTMLRLDAPFGPLQSMGVTVTWTITLSAVDGGTTVTFTEVANGSEASGLDKIAPAVDSVKQQAIERLVAIEAVQ